MQKQFRKLLISIHFFFWNTLRGTGYAVLCKAIALESDASCLPVMYLPGAEQEQLESSPRAGDEDGRTSVLPLVSDSDGVNILPQGAFLKGTANMGEKGFESANLTNSCLYLNSSVAPIAHRAVQSPIGIKTPAHLLLFSLSHPVPTGTVFGITWCSKNGIYSLTLYLEFSSLFFLYGHFFLLPQD